MPDQWGRPTMDDGLRVMQGIGAMKQADQTERRMKMLEDEQNYLKKERERTGKEREAERVFSDFYMNTDPNDPEYSAKLSTIVKQHKDAGTYNAAMHMKAMGAFASSRLQNEQTRAAKMRNDLVAAEDSLKKGQSVITAAASAPLSMDTAQTVVDLLDDYPGTGLYGGTVTSIDDDNNVTFTAKDSSGKDRTITQPWADVVNMARGVYRQENLPEYAKQYLFRGQIIQEHNLKALSNYDTMVDGKGEKIYIYNMQDRKGRPFTFSMDSSGELVSLDGKISDLPESVRQMLPDNGEKLPKLPPASYKRVQTTAEQEAAIKGQKQTLEEDKFEHEKTQDAAEKEKDLRKEALDILKWKYGDDAGLGDDGRPDTETAERFINDYVKNNTGGTEKEPAAGNAELDKARQGIIERGEDETLSDGTQVKVGRIGDTLHIYNTKTKEWGTAPVTENVPEEAKDKPKEKPTSKAKEVVSKDKTPSKAPNLSREDKKLLNYYAKEIQKKNPDKSKKAIAEEALQMVQDAKEKQRAMAGNLGSQIKGRARDIAEPIEKLRSMVPRVERVEPAKEEDFSQYLK